MHTRLATRMSLPYLAAALVAGVALSFAPTAPVYADEPGVRAPRIGMAPPRVRARTVVRTVDRVRYVPVHHTCGGCAQAVVLPAPRFYYAPPHYAGCGGCVQPVALPYYWAVRYARYRYAHFYY